MLSSLRLLIFLIFACLILRNLLLNENDSRFWYCLFRFSGKCLNLCFISSFSDYKFCILWLTWHKSRPWIFFQVDSLESHNFFFNFSFFYSNIHIILFTLHVMCFGITPCLLHSERNIRLFSTEANFLLFVFLDLIGYFGSIVESYFFEETHIIDLLLTRWEFIVY